MRFILLYWCYQWLGWGRVFPGFQHLLQEWNKGIHRLWNSKNTLCKAKWQCRLPPEWQWVSWVEECAEVLISLWSFLFWDSREGGVWVLRGVRWVVLLWSMGLDHVSVSSLCMPLLMLHLILMMCTHNYAWTQDGQYRMLFHSSLRGHTCPFNMHPKSFEIRLGLFPSYLETVGIYLNGNCLSWIIVGGWETYSIVWRSTWGSSIQWRSWQVAKCIVQRGLCVHVGNGLRLPRALLEEGWGYQLESWDAKLIQCLSVSSEPT